MAVRGGKTFAAKQKVRELKKIIFRLKTLEKKVSKQISPFEIKKSVDNMNSLPTAKYKQIPNEIEKNTLKLVSAIYYQIFLFSPNDSPSKTIKNVLYFI